MFDSFVLAGFDCTVSRNRHGRRIDTPRATEHRRRLHDDYVMVRRLGITAVRDGVPWPEICGQGRWYDWASLDHMIETSRRCGLEVIYDLCHFGYPEHLDVFSGDFVQQFADFSYRCARRIGARSERRCFISPINEPSYFAWAAAHVALFPPYCRERAFDLKVQLVRAIIAATDAIWAAVPDARIVSVDPICRAVAPLSRPDLLAAQDHFNSGPVLEAWDMIAGKLLPELGGSPEHLGILGVNYYWTNQWEIGSEDTPLSEDDVRIWPLSRLVKGLWDRYGVPLLISETGHIGAMRATWVRQLAAEARAMIAAGVPLEGICLYPILGMPSWHDEGHWLPMGLWDVSDGGERVLHAPMLSALSELQMLSSPHHDLAAKPKGVFA